jgi:hypothetical protein
MNIELQGLLIELAETEEKLLHHHKVAYDFLDRVHRGSPKKKELMEAHISEIEKKLKHIECKEKIVDRLVKIGNALREDLEK